MATKTASRTIRLIGSLGLLLLLTGCGGSGLRLQPVGAVDVAGGDSLSMRYNSPGFDAGLFTGPDLGRSGLGLSAAVDVLAGMTGRPKTPAVEQFVFVPIRSPGHGRAFASETFVFINAPYTYSGVTIYDPADRAAGYLDTFTITGSKTRLSAQRLVQFRPPLRYEYAEHTVGTDHDPARGGTVQVRFERTGATEPMLDSFRDRQELRNTAGRPVYASDVTEDWPLAGDTLVRGQEVWYRGDGLWISGSFDIRYPDPYGQATLRLGTASYRGGDGTRYELVFTAAGLAGTVRDASGAQVGKLVLDARRRILLTDLAGRPVPRADGQQVTFDSAYLGPDGLYARSATRGLAPSEQPTAR
jgi:hypothetical protein